VRIFKVVARWFDVANRPTWLSPGKLGTQAKKTVYTSLSDFERYSPAIIARWVASYGKIEVYECKGGAWKKISEKTRSKSK
jgi:hypothetical protein